MVSKIDSEIPKRHGYASKWRCQENLSCGTYGIKYKKYLLPATIDSNSVD